MKELFISGLKFILNPVKKIIYQPSFRYSNNFRGLMLNPREEMLKVAIQFVQASKLTGDYLEFGVYKGSTFIAAYHLAKHNGLNNMNFYAFDSFQGLPEIKGIDSQDKQYAEGQYAFSQEKFKKNLLNNSIDLNKIKIVPGWFNDSLNSDLKKKLNIKRAAIIWIDCDLYESTIPILNFIKEYLSDGVVIIFDDWYCYAGNPERGEQRAFREWLTLNQDIKAIDYHKFGWHGNSFIIHKIEKSINL